MCVRAHACAHASNCDVVEVACQHIGVTRGLSKYTPYFADVLPEQVSPLLEAFTQVVCAYDTRQRDRRLDLQVRGHRAFRGPGGSDGIGWRRRVGARWARWARRLVGAASRRLVRCREADAGVVALRVALRIVVIFVAVSTLASSGGRLVSQHLQRRRHWKRGGAIVRETTGG